MRLPNLPDPLTIDPATVDNAVLRRLITEVQQEMGARPGAYDRIHQRHNRGVAPRPPVVEPQEGEAPQDDQAQGR